MRRLVPRSLYARMLLISAAATVLALALAGAVMAGLLGRFVLEGLDRRLDAQLLVLASVIDRDGHVDQGLLAERAVAFGDGPEWQWRIVGPDGAIGAVELAAPRAVLTRPIEGALAPLLLALAAIAALLTAALLIQLRIGLRPVRALREQVAAIRSGARARVDEEQPAELQPLAAELNALAADSEAALAAARGAAANLAHALKTPVAALAVDLRDQPRHAAAVARIDHTIRHHLARARATAINRRVATPLAPALADIVAVVQRLHAGTPLAVQCDIADVAVAVDAQDLDELLGNLLDNAARHATSRIAITARRDGRHVRLAIADDGPGIPATHRAQVLHAGTRLDERGDGHGFGLSIVAELTALYGGTLTLGEHPPHGLLVTLTLPAA